MTRAAKRQQQEDQLELLNLPSIEVCIQLEELEYAEAGCQEVYVTMELCSGLERFQADELDAIETDPLLEAMEELSAERSEVDETGAYLPAYKAILHQYAQEDASADVVVSDVEVSDNDNDGGA